MDERLYELLVEIYEEVTRTNRRDVMVSFSNHMLDDLRVLESNGLIRIAGMSNSNIAFKFLTNAIEVVERYIADTE